MCLKDVSCVHQGSIYLIENTVKLWKMTFSILTHFKIELILVMAKLNVQQPLIQSIMSRGPLEIIITGWFAFKMVYCFEQHLSMTMIWFTLTLRSVLWEEILRATDSMQWGSTLSPSEGDALSEADSDAYITGSSQWGRVLQGRLTLHSGASPSTVPEKLNTPWCYETNTKKKTPYMHLT